LQRRIRAQINSGRPNDQQITYEHIKSGHPDFKEKYAQMVVDRYNQTSYLKKINEQHDREALDPEVYSQVAAYQPGELNYHFRKIPSSVKKEIAQSFGLTHNYTKDTKIKIITTFISQYMA
jgi:hypothetical protein